MSIKLVEGKKQEKFNKIAELSIDAVNGGRNTLVITSDTRCSTLAAMIICGCERIPTIGKLGVKPVKTFADIVDSINRDKYDIIAIDRSEVLKNKRQLLELKNTYPNKTILVSWDLKDVQVSEF